MGANNSTESTVKVKSESLENSLQKNKMMRNDQHQQMNEIRLTVNKAQGT
jgi:hypothetical protein